MKRAAGVLFLFLVGLCPGIRAETIATDEYDRVIAAYLGEKCRSGLEHVALFMPDTNRFVDVTEISGQLWALPKVGKFAELLLKETRVIAAHCHPLSYGWLLSELGKKPRRE